MKHILIYTIQLYWSIIPKHKRRTCLFEESCSNYVYRITQDKGFYKGFLALRKRFYQCRPGYQLYKNKQNNSFELLLSDGSIIKNETISKKLLPPLNTNCSIKA